MFSLSTKENVYIKNVSVLVSGAMLAQLIQILATPVITRLYSPENIGAFAFYVSVLAVIGTIANGKYEHAVVLSTNKSTTTNLIALCLLITGVISVLLVLAVILLVVFMGLDIIYLLLPLSFAVYGVGELVVKYVVRDQLFQSVSVSRVIKTTVSATLKIVVALAFIISPVILVTGEIVGGVIAIVFILWKEEVTLELARVTVDRIKAVARQYSDFMIFEAPGQMVSIFSSHMPVFLISGVFGAKILGFYGLTRLVLDAPLHLVTASVREVFYQRAVSDQRAHGDCRALLISSVVKLLGLSGIVFILIWPYWESLFAFVFGPEWVVAGEYAKILSVMYLFKFNVSPFASVFMITGKQSELFRWQIGILLFSVAAICWSYTFNGGDIFDCLIAYAIAYSLFYIMLFVRIFKLSAESGNKTPL